MRTPPDSGSEGGCAANAHLGRPRRPAGLSLEQSFAAGRAISVPGNQQRVWLRLENYAELSLVYGPDCADSVMAKLADVAHGLDWALSCRVSRDRTDLLRVELPSGSNAPLDPLSAVESLLVQLSSTPLCVADARIMPALAAWDARPAMPGQDRAVRLPLGHQGFRRDMGLAVAVYDAIRRGHLALTWQPVADCASGGIVYYEALSRLCPEDGGATSSPDEFILALERLGLTRCFDRWVAKTVLSALVADPTTRLGCNISMLSAMDDAWWRSVLVALEAQPTIADRLVVEFTETAECDLSAASTLIARLRRAGCRIAIDDFGTGHSSIALVLALAPDILKLDTSFLRDELPSTLLRALASLGSALAPYVIAEGVEDRRRGTRARLLGAQGIQGWGVGAPQIHRAWAVSPWPCRQAAAS